MVPADTSNATIKLYNNIAAGAFWRAGHWAA
jgi:hypothetical protein